MFGGSSQTEPEEVRLEPDASTPDGDGDEMRRTGLWRNELERLRSHTGSLTRLLAHFLRFGGTGVGGFGGSLSTEPEEMVGALGYNMEVCHRPLIEDHVALRTKVHVSEGV